MVDALITIRIVKFGQISLYGNRYLRVAKMNTKYSRSLTLTMCRSSDSPDGTLLDKTKKIDTNQSEGDSFFPIPKEHNNVNSQIQERAMMGGPLKYPM
jgi:hypothetical protein